MMPPYVRVERQSGFHRHAPVGPGGSHERDGVLRLWRAAEVRLRSVWHHLRIMRALRPVAAHGSLRARSRTRNRSHGGGHAGIGGEASDVKGRRGTPQRSPAGGLAALAESRANRTRHRLASRAAGGRSRPIGLPSRAARPDQRPAIGVTPGDETANVRKTSTRSPSDGTDTEPEPWQVGAVGIDAVCRLATSAYFASRIIPSSRAICSN